MLRLPASAPLRPFLLRSVNLVAAVLRCFDRDRSTSVCVWLRCAIGDTDR